LPASGLLPEEQGKQVLNVLCKEMMQLCGIERRYTNLSFSGHVLRKTKRRLSASSLVLWDPQKAYDIKSARLKKEQEVWSGHILKKVLRKLLRIPS
jgi:hypothetical protein